MAACREIVAGALRKIGRLGSGRDPRQVDGDTGMESLRSYYSYLITSGILGRLRDVVPTADYVARENERVFRDNDNCTQVTLPLTVEDWDTGCGDPCVYGSRWVPPSLNNVERNQRPPRDGAPVIISDGFTGVTGEFLYSGYIREWQSVYDLQPADYAPLSRRDAEGLTAAISLRVADEFGATPGAMTIRQAATFENSLAQRWSFPRRQVASEYF